MTKLGLARPIVIPQRQDLKENIVLGIGRTLGLTKKEMLDRLDSKRRKNNPVNPRYIIIYLIKVLYAYRFNPHFPIPNLYT